MACVNINETWIVYLWRPMMGWVYMVICLFDFMIAPVFFTMVGLGAEGVKWQAVTLQGSGLFHLSMLTILGVTAWGRNQQRLKELDLIATSPTTPTSSPPSPTSNGQA